MAWARILLLFGCFESASAKARLATICNGFCAAGVRVFQNCASSKGLCQWLRNQNYASQAMPRRLYRVPDKRINVFMGSKGNGKHFVGLHFAWHGLESCCCLSVSKALRQEHLLQRFCRALYHLAWTRQFRNCASQGFTWHAVACCWRSSVAELRLQ